MTDSVIAEGALSCVDGAENIYRDGSWVPTGLSCIPAESGGYARITADGLSIVPISDTAAKATRASDCVKFIAGGYLTGSVRVMNNCGVCQMVQISWFDGQFETVRVEANKFKDVPIKGGGGVLAGNYPC